MPEHIETDQYLIRYSHCHSYYSTVKLFSFPEGSNRCFWVAVVDIICCGEPNVTRRLCGSESTLPQI